MVEAVTAQWSPFARANQRGRENVEAPTALRRDTPQTHTGGLAVPEGPAPTTAVLDAEALPLTPLELFQRLHARGVRLRPFPDGTLQCQAPSGAWTPALRQAFQAHHGALHALVETFEERAALAEHSGGLTRAEAEQLAWLCSGKDQRGPGAGARP